VKSPAAGARGILTTSARPADLVKALRMVHQGEIWARRQVMAAWIEHLARDYRDRSDGESLLAGRLSDREREVFRLAATGLGNKELAERLAISQATVKVHLTHIFQKLGLRGRAELAAAYHGLASPSRSAPRRSPSWPPTQEVGAVETERPR
jgi:DNA-binding NarL/FixJ family response regulator